MNTALANALHDSLCRFNAQRLRPRLVEDWCIAELEDQIPMVRSELAFVESERRKVAELAAQAPHEAHAFVAWFENLRTLGAGQGDPLFPWLAEQASSEEMNWFLTQEVAGEAGFEDLVALTQVQLPTQAKLELARNYWDEMGRGNAGGLHGAMLADMANALGLHPSTTPIVWESKALGNLMIALASHRHYVYQSIGALGVIELTPPDRAARVNAGLARLGVAGETRRYFAVHATLDVKHSEAWNREVLFPLVAADQRVARAIAEGALMRLAAGARCFERYRAELSRFSAASVAA